ncbi:AMP-binding protein [Streptomyces triticagri]|uniref:AMP-binding protein n=1 Tax=Streptomyces triticagri TaxID=2293568 RepID=UPI0013148CE5|nr:AMP-binding protein [Streptomyces triticagri]
MSDLGIPSATAAGGGSAVPGLIHEAVAAHAARTPDAPAVSQGRLRLTYGELDRAAEVFAAELRRRGAGPGTLVPVAVERSPLLVAVLLGVLKCGAGYAALDPSWPEQRLRTVVAALDPPVAVGRALEPGRVWEPGPLRVHSAGEEVPHARVGHENSSHARVEQERVEQESNRHAPVDPSATAAVFFTSGTSGAPKGVLSPHRATTRLFAGPDRIAGLGPGRVMAQAAPVAWDAFTLEVWGALTSGAACAMSESGSLLPDDLRDLVSGAGVDTLWITSSLFNLFMDEDPDAFAGLTHVLTGGEVLSPAHVRAFLRRHPHTALINGYGPVESCVFATTHRITAADCDRPDGIPVGTPVPHTGVHLVDGEIWVSGEGLAAGYLSLPEATAERFTTLTVDGRPTRAYRTGDRGFLDADGVLHFRGRTDRQVKIAGHRVEPAETEAAARQVPGLRDCAVVPVNGRLELYYTTRPERPVTAATVRRALRTALPRHLVPHTVHALPALPVTANGKTDRDALTRRSRP